MTSTSQATATTAAEIRSFGPWFHNLQLGGVSTAPDHFLGDYPRVFFERFSSALPQDLQGWSVLDVGCNAGFYSFEMARRGAKRVVGMDCDDRYLAQARYAARWLGPQVEFRHQSVYDVYTEPAPYDLVLFMGVLYHLRHPLLALDLLRRYAVGRLLVFQSMIRGESDGFTGEQDYAFVDRSPFEDAAFPRMFFIEHRYAGDPTNWWIPNGACAEALLRSAGFRIVARPDAEVFICAVDASAAPLPEIFTSNASAGTR